MREHLTTRSSSSCIQTEMYKLTNGQRGHTSGSTLVNIPTNGSESKVSLRKRNSADRRLVEAYHRIPSSISSLSPNNESKIARTVLQTCHKYYSQTSSHRLCHNQRLDTLRFMLTKRMDIKPYCLPLALQHSQLCPPPKLRQLQTQHFDGTHR